ncbi:MAG: hypothetical protein HY819_11500 [Acidobacteria bacterium]|nr:hypothetical protein [Acidobacteriota bacterium]
MIYQITRDGKKISNNFLVVAGIQIDWDKIKGLKESLGKDGYAQPKQEILRKLNSIC